MMRTITLRALVREPRKVKRLTRGGASVHVTDNGRPLWLIQPAITQDDDERRRRDMEEELARVLLEPQSKIPLSEIILAARR